MRAAGLTARALFPAASRRVLGWSAAALLAVGAIAVADRQGWQAATPAKASALDPAGLVPGYGPASFSAALTAAEVKVSAKRELLAREPRDWLRMEGLAR